MSKSVTIDNIAEITYKENCILVMKMAQKSTINLDEAKKIVEETEKLVGEEDHCNLVDISEMTFMSGEARRLFGNQRKKSVMAVGVVMNSKFQRALVNLYQKINRPVIPTKFFEDANKAEEWLLEKL